MERHAAGTWALDTRIKFASEKLKEKEFFRKLGSDGNRPMYMHEFSVKHGGGRNQSRICLWLCPEATICVNKEKSIQVEEWLFGRPSD